MTTVIRWAAGTLVLGIAAGMAWLLLANPARWEVTDAGTILTEEGAKGRFAVIVSFVLIGIVASFLGGLIAGVRLRDRGWSLVPAFALTALVAGIIAWQVGVVLGPPDPATVTGTSVGDKIPQQLAVDSVTPFLVWPIFALVGLLLAVYSAGDGGAKSASHRGEVVGS